MLSMLWGDKPACIQFVIIWSSAVLPAPVCAHAPSAGSRVSESPSHSTRPETCPDPPARMACAFATHPLGPLCQASSYELARSLLLLVEVVTVTVAVAVTEPLAFVAVNV